MRAATRLILPPIPASSPLQPPIAKRASTSRATRGDYVAARCAGRVDPTAAAGGGEATQSGTSFAVPYVTVAAASLLSRDAALDAAAVSQYLSTTARDLGRPGRDPVYGWGLFRKTAGICDWPRSAPLAPIAGGYDAPWIDRRIFPQGSGINTPLVRLLHKFAERIISPTCPAGQCASPRSPSDDD